MQRLFDYIGSRLTGRDDFSAQYRRYRETVQWLVRELLAFDSRSTLKAVVFNVLGGVLKAGALAFLLYYANLMEVGADISLLGYSLEARSETMFYFAMTMAMVLLLCGAFATYGGSHVISRLSVAFAANCSQNIIASSGGRPAGNPHPSQMTYPASLSGRVSGVVRLSRAVKSLLQAANPLATLVYSLFVLFYLNASLSLAVMVLALSTLFLQYKVNYQSAQNEKQLTISRGKGMRRLKRLLEESALTPKMSASAVAWLRQEYQASAIGGFLHCYYQRLMAQPRSALVSDLLLAILSFLLVIYLGRKALLGDTGWAHFLGYLLFARISLLAFRGVLVSITGFARHYPRARLVYEYFRSLSGDGQPVADAIVITARGKDCIGDRKKARLQPGKPMLLLSPVTLSRFNLYAFIDALAGGTQKDNNALSVASVCIARGFDALPGGSLNELLAIPAAATQETVSHCLHAVGLPADISRDQLLTVEAWQEFPLKTRARILLQQARQVAAPLLLVDSAVLDASGADHALSWLQAMAGNRVVIVSDRLQDLQQYDGKAVVLMAQDRSVSVANIPWCEDNRAAINAWFERHLAEVEEEEADDDDLLEDE